MSASFSKRPLVYLTRREAFSAAHTLHNNDLSAEENKKIFSKCNNCHGHNYVVYITVKGRVNPVTGMVINITDLKGFIAEILDDLDHKNFDSDVEYFKNVVSSTENLCVYIWDRLERRLKEFRDKNDQEDCQLHEVKIHETEKNICIYRGE